LSEKGSTCERCGYNKCLSALQVHHLDKNRSNNRLENLMVLCANCHCEVHHNDRQMGS
jgi:5-methylcytosine-specific restriction endonuclease McrA